jgi:uncharacterized NAD(P)/FAD-binding protein YdhS
LTLIFTAYIENSTIIIITKMKTKKRIAIVGGGPSALFLYKRLLESGETNFEVEIFEKKNTLGSGMPYSSEGANDEHVTNVSDNETPDLVTSISDWLRMVPASLLERFSVNIDTFNEYKVLPRLLFGMYLTEQFNMLNDIANKLDITTHIHYHTTVFDIEYDKDDTQVWIITANDKILFDDVIICTGHAWPSRLEGKYKGCYDSPYPPSKLEFHVNHAVAIRGASLTAIDAVRTLARQNGKFEYDSHHNLCYRLNEQSQDFKIVMHSRGGLLPAVRFHLEDSHLSNDYLLNIAEIKTHIT